MIVMDVDPRRHLVLTKFPDGREYAYTVTDLLDERNASVLAAALGWATVELRESETRWRVWQAEQFLALREARPSEDGKRPKKMSEKDAEAAVKTTDAYSRMRGDVGRAAAAANMLEVLAATVSAGLFRRQDRQYTKGSAG